VRTVRAYAERGVVVRIAHRDVGVEGARALAAKDDLHSLGRQRDQRKPVIGAHDDHRLDGGRRDVPQQFDTPHHDVRAQPGDGELRHSAAARSPRLGRFAQVRLDIGRYPPANPGVTRPSRHVDRLVNDVDQDDDRHRHRDRPHGYHIGPDDVALGARLDDEAQESTDDGVGHRHCKAGDGDRAQ